MARSKSTFSPPLIYNETIPDYMNPSLDLFGKNRFDIALNCYYKKGDVFAPCLIGSFYFAPITSMSHPVLF
jgi:hypothetical protein